MFGFLYVLHPLQLLSFGLTAKYDYDYLNYGDRQYCMNSSRFLALMLILLSPMVQGQEYHLIRVTPVTEASFRGLSVVDDDVAWISGNKGTVGRSTDGGRTWQVQQVPGFENADFRSLNAFDDQRAVIANAGSPGYILRTENGGKDWATVYTNSHPGIFFDGIDFWNAEEGMIYGDPLDGKLLLLRTGDGGKTWDNVETAPSLEKGEASFAASGTGIRCTGKRDLLICTGGKVSRLWLSEDAGIRWTAFSPPMIQGNSSTGIFSAARQGKDITLVGGDFQNESLSKAHHVYSTDQGRTWNVPQIPARGYRECVEFITENTLIAVGPAGADVSTDGGTRWVKLFDEKGLHVIRKARKGKLLVAAGNTGTIFLIAP